MSHLLNYFAATCQGGSFFGFPTWYKYLDGVTDSTGCVPKITGINDVWLIVAAVLEMLLRVAAAAALLFVVWGGIQYIMSKGEPEHTQKARSTVINALVGLVISVVAAAVVSFIAGSFK